MFWERSDGVLREDSRRLSAAEEGLRGAVWRGAALTGFVAAGGSVTLRRSVTGQFYCKAGTTMAMKCELCGKGPAFGNVISHANNTRRRRWNPNLRRVRAVVNGARKHVRVCTACIRDGRVKKAA
jgi:large subunit ribosomal protein L28